MSKQEVSDQEKQCISKERLNEMKQETFKLIRQFCKTKKLSDTNYLLYLHDKTLINFTKYDSTEIDRFCWLVEQIVGVIYELIPKLSYESDIQYPVTEYVMGSIDFEKTRILRQTEGKKLVCIQYSKNLFVYENVLLVAVILGINTMAMQLLKKWDKWKEESVEKIKGHDEKLDGIINLTNFWLKDRNVSKLRNHYYQNFQGIEYLFEKTLYRLRMGKVDRKYHPLIKFIQWWKKYDQILNEEDSSLEAKLSSLDIWDDDARAYEIWIFYQMLKLFFVNGQEVDQKSSSPDKFSKNQYTIEYQFNKPIGWIRLGRDNKGAKYNEIPRRPDIVIKKGSDIVAMIDAKYMKYGSKTDKKSDNIKGMPDTKIVNQMIIAMDYGDPKNRTDLGIVLFADDRKQDDVVIDKIQKHKKIHFLNMHPENKLLMDDAFVKIKNIVGIKV